MSPNLSPPTPILSGGVGSMLGAQSGGEGVAPIFFSGSMGANVGAGGEIEKPRDYGIGVKGTTVSSLKYHNTDLEHHKEQGRRIIEEMKNSRYKNNPWIKDMIQFYEDNGGRPPREEHQGGYKSWQEVYDQWETWRNQSTAEDRDKPLPFNRWKKGTRK